jgi:hypothetical protein
MISSVVLLHSDADKAAFISQCKDKPGPIHSL